jgi:hypothetical protein
MKAFFGSVAKFHPLLMRGAKSRPCKSHGLHRPLATSAAAPNSATALPPCPEQPYFCLSSLLIVFAPPLSDKE